MREFAGAETRGRKMRAAGRVAGRRAIANRWVHAGLVGMESVGHATAQLLRGLWLQITGLFFLLFAMIGVSAAVREYRAWQMGTAGPQKFWFSAAFALVFGYFAITSFLRSGRRGSGLPAHSGPAQGSKR